MTLVLLLGLASGVFGFDTRKISVWSNTSFVQGNLDPRAAAMAIFEDSMNTTGWGILNIKTNGSFTDIEQGYAAGFAEGVLTAPRIWEHYINMMPVIFGDDKPHPKVVDFFNAQDAWTRAQITANPKDLFWQQVAHLTAQLDGLVDGYNAVCASYHAQPIDRFGFWSLNSDGDLFQIIPAVEKEKRPNFDRMTNDEIHQYLTRHGRCSALIKVTPDLSNLFVGHSSWYAYATTNRIFKHYDFAFTSPRASNTVAFSSYPAYLESLDDYYLMSGSGLAMVQTSIDFTNSSLYDLIKPQSLLAWQRVRVAHHLAHNGSEWHSVVSTAASGTYCNTYMVVDFNKFTPGQALTNDLLWLIEEVPGVVAGTDLTPILQFGYWPSYNVPFQPEAVEVSGYRELAARGVASADFQLAPRAKIFRRDVDTVVDMASYQAILRSNNYKNDPFSEGDPCNQICCREDLRGRPGGCYDTKVTDYYNFWNTRSWIVNGPTRDNGLPPFSWSQFPNVSHVGLPPVYNFDFVENTPYVW